MGGGGGIALTFGHGGSFSFGWQQLPSKKPKQRPGSSNGQNANRAGRGGGGGKQWQFPLKSAVTAASLALTGDTIAQVRDRFISIQTEPGIQNSSPPNKKDIVVAHFMKHDWLRALRMTTYGFLLYGPGSQAWYELLDKTFPQQSLRNLSVKVILNQIVLGPCVIAVVFAWNSLWQGKLKELPDKYRKDAIPTLVYGWKFWTPASLLNFWAVPLQMRVAFMSSCSIFWNFYLSTTMVKS
uniref:TSA: Wollemia nobilis Ref_Wollemi_Transcript_29192_1028 transcribed RNA sequence n=1 Tax=Wollemia nobilis TaxID=56998 RepID=A0A0C9S0Q8_9CONI